jgi:hypothetical protein
MQLNKSLLAAALASALTACGGSDDKEEAPIVITPTKTVIQGKAIKGTLSNAVVTVYKFIDGAAVALTDSEIEEANIVSTDDGSYTFTLLDYSGPVKVELSPSTDSSNPTVMNCDAPQGCAATEFGEKINLTSMDPNFKLSAISVVDEESTGEVKVNVSALTHLASAMIESSELGITSESVQRNSSLIANAFNINGSITNLEPTVVDNAAAVVNEDNANELRYGLINAGIMSAIFSDEDSSENVLSSKFIDIAADLIAHDGAFLVNQDTSNESFELALGDVLSGAAEVIKKTVQLINEDDSLSDTAAVLSDLQQAETNLENEKVAQEALADDTGRSQIGSEVVTNGDAIAKAAAMVSDVRLFANLFDVTGTANKEISTQGDEYIALIDDASVMVEAEAQSFTLLAELSDVISELTMQYDEGELEGTVHDISKLLSADDAQGTITFDETNLIFKIDAVSNGQAVKLNVAVVFSEDKLSIALNFDGMIDSAGANITLAEGSKAQINLDSIITRESLENDTFEGEISSGELKLEVSISQKLSEDVINPVSFTGLLHTKLMPVKIPTLDESWQWDEEAEEDFASYAKPVLETAILPEVLTLSGGFSSLDGNLIKATLTVSINNLEGYQGPNFEYIGKEIPELLTINMSDDLNSITIDSLENVENKSIETRKFIPGNQIGEWSATSSVVAADPETHFWGTGIERQVVSRTFDVDGLHEKGIMYTRAYVTGSDGFGAKQIRITPVDYDNDQFADAYQFEQIGTWDGLDYNEDALLNAEGDILTADGQIHSFDDAWFMGEFASIESMRLEHPYAMIANPLTVNDGAQLLSQTITSWWGNQRGFDVDNEGKARVFFNDDLLSSIATGESKTFTLSGFLTEPLVKDSLSIQVSEDSNTLIESITNASTKTLSYTGVAGDFSVNLQMNYSDSSTLLQDYNIVSTDVGLDFEEVLVSYDIEHNPWQWHSRIKIAPQDDNFDGKVDEFNVIYLSSEYINSDGDLIDDAGQLLTFERNGWKLETFYNYGDVKWNEEPFSWSLPFNPLTTADALSFYTDTLINRSYKSSLIEGYIEDIGLVEAYLSEDDLAMLVAGKTVNFDMHNVVAEKTESIENEETFLDVNAALSLQVILGEYQVDLQLSGDRTGLEEGKFDLDMSYKLPGEELQRSFVAHANTEQMNMLTLTNSEGVTVNLSNSAEADASEVVLGTITVGDDEEQVAQIVNRDGLVLIVYADGTVEAL